MLNIGSKDRIVVHLNAGFVKFRLTQMNRSLKWFAEQIDVQEPYVTLMMNQKRGLSPYMRQKIMTALRGQKWDDLFLITR